MKKIIVGGLLAGLAIMVVSFIIGSMTADMYKMSNAAMWKPMGQDWFWSMLAYDFVVGLILAYVWSIVKGAIPGTGIQKGLFFGLLVFLLGTIPGMGMTYLTMNIRNKMIIVWTMNGLFNYLLAGAAIEWAEKKLN